MNTVKKERKKIGKIEDLEKVQNNGKDYANRVNLGEKTETHVDNRVRKAESLFENLTWLTSSEAAEYLRLPSVGALRVLVFKREIPFHKLGRNLRFKRIELDRWLDVSRIGGI